MRTMTDMSEVENVCAACGSSIGNGVMDECEDCDEKGCEYCLDYETFTGTVLCTGCVEARLGDVK